MGVQPEAGERASGSTDARATPVLAVPALHVACFMGNLGAVRLLLQRGADPSLRLITRAEVEESDVSEAEAAAFAASALTASAPLEPDDGGETQC